MGDIDSFMGGLVLPIPRIPLGYVDREKLFTEIAAAATAVMEKTLAATKERIENNKKAIDASTQQQLDNQEKQRVAEEKAKTEAKEKEALNWLTTIGLACAAVFAALLIPGAAPAVIAALVVSTVTAGLMAVVSLVDNSMKASGLDNVDVSIDELIRYSVEHDAIYQSLSPQEKEKTRNALSIFGKVMEGVCMAAGFAAVGAAAIGPILRNAIVEVSKMTLQRAATEAVALAKDAGTSIKNVGGTIKDAANAAKIAAQDMTKAQLAGSLFGSVGGGVGSAQQIRQSEINLALGGIQFHLEKYKAEGDLLGAWVSYLTQISSGATAALGEMKKALDDMLSGLEGMIDKAARPPAQA
jgi:hypothetical protein